MAKSSASSSQPTSEESSYERVIHNRPLTPAFFEDLSTDSADEEGDSDDEGRPFQFNRDHCLHVFNALKHGYGVHSNSSSNNSYVNLSHQSRAEYLRHLELIDL